MSVQWTIKNGGVERTLDAWGVRDPVLVRRSYRADDFTFSVPRKDVLQPATFADESEIILKRDGVPQFIGKVVYSSAEYALGAEVDRYLIQNAWYDLDRLVYQQQRCLWNGPFSATTTQLSSQVVLGQTTNGGRYVTTTAAMAAVVTFALTKSVPIVAGLTIGGVDFPVEEVRDLTCGEVIRRLAAYTPDSVTWVDYSTGVQVLNFARRASLTPVTIDLISSGYLEAWEIRKRVDLVPKGVRFDFIGGETMPSSGQVMTRITTQQAGTSDLPGSIVATIDLDSAGLNAQTPVPGNLASSYYLALLSPQYEGSIVTRGRDILGNVRIGNSLNLTGGRAEWATMQAMVDVVTEDISTGATTVAFGPAEQLSSQDFIDQLMFARRMRANTGLWGTQTCIRFGPDIDDDGEVPGTGGEQEDNPDKGRNPDDASTPSVSVQVCEGGQQKTLVIKGQYAS